MNRDYEQDDFSKSVLAGVFSGIAATVVILIYNFYYRGVSGFSLSDIVNVSTVIFVSVLFLTVCGLIFHLFHHYIKQGMIVYIIVFVLLTVGALSLLPGVQRSPNPEIAAQFRKLMMGVTIIMGFFCAIGIPYFFKSDKI